MKPTQYFPIPRSEPSTTNSEGPAGEKRLDGLPAKIVRAGTARLPVAAKAVGVQTALETLAERRRTAGSVKKQIRLAGLLENSGEAAPVPHRKTKVGILGESARGRHVPCKSERLNGFWNNVQVTNGI